MTAPGPRPVSTGLGPHGLVVRIEGTLWPSLRAFDAACAHLAGRFARVCGTLELPGDAAPMAAGGAGEPPAAQVVRLSGELHAIAAWAGDAVDWRRELARFFDEHLPLHVRADRAVNQAVRALAADHDLVAASALPEASLMSLLGHLGLGRAFATLAPDVPAGALATAWVDGANHGPTTSHRPDSPGFASAYPADAVPHTVLEWSALAVTPSGRGQHPNFESPRSSAATPR